VITTQVRRRRMTMTWNRIHWHSIILALSGKDLLVPWKSIAVTLKLCHSNEEAFVFSEIAVNELVIARPCNDVRSSANDLGCF
jgi:hypothetical protein